MEQLSILFKALSDPFRLQIVRLLLRNGKEAYGEELARALKVPAYRLSRHLKILKATGVIQERRQGRWVYYSLAENGELPAALRRMIADAKVPRVNGNDHSLPRSSRASSGPAQAKRKRPAIHQNRPSASTLDEFDWNQGPAIPGVL